MVGYADGRSYVKRCSGLGKVSDRAIDGTASKRNLTRLEQSAAWGCSMLVHCMDLRHVVMMRANTARRHLFPNAGGYYGGNVEARMTPRERKDMPWQIAVFVVVILIILGGTAFLWR